MKIGVVGHLGVVGGAVRHGLQRIGHQVRGFDTAQPGGSLEEVFDTEVTFVCVPTPTDRDGVCDVSRVEDTIIGLDRADYQGVIAIKSTVIPGTTKQWQSEFPRRIVFCPEFLRERAAVVDFYENHDLCVIGADDVIDFAVVKAAHGRLPRHVVHVTPTEAELCKYFSNVFNALRVVFANEFYEVAKALGADYGVIKAAMVQRSTIEDVYLDCNENMRGFGGVCLPKDTVAFARLVADLSLLRPGTPGALQVQGLKLFQAIVEENKKFRTTVPPGMRP